jgi:POT family proton-dependent oligopeptide transporter
VHTVDGAVVDLSAALASYTELFYGLLVTGLGVAALLLLISPLLKKMMHGIH